ncbi:MAG: hypothetical protein U1E66_14655 [Rhodospirillales bacterium]
MTIHSGRRPLTAWVLRQGDTAAPAEALGRGRRILAAALVLPLIVATSVVARLLRGGEPRVSGRIGRAEKTALRRAFRARLTALLAEGTPFPLSSVLPFSWRRVYVIAAMEDPRGAIPSLDPERARRLGSDRSDVLLIEREPEGLVRIDFGTGHNLVSADPAGLGGSIDGDIVVSAVRIAGVRYLRLGAAGAPEPA